jgi:predicted transcriptional regulator
MKTSKLSYLRTKLLIARMVANGNSQRKIAEALGSSQPAISRIVHQNDIQEMIRKETTLILQEAIRALKEAMNDPRTQAVFQQWAMKELFRGILPNREIDKVSNRIALINNNP